MGALPLVAPRPPTISIMFGLPADYLGSRTAQVGWMVHERRSDSAKFAGSRVRASMMFQPCFLAVETKERMSAKSIVPSNERSPPATGRSHVGDCTAFSPHASNQ